MSEIVREEMLVMVSASVNSNKFYHVTLDNAGVLTKRWGRVGADGAVDVSRGATERQFESVVKAKKKRGYVPTGIVSSGSNVKSTDGDQLEKVAKSVLA